MRVLITGAGGFAGGHLADLCLARGHETLGLARHEPAGHGLGGWLCADLEDEDQTRAAIAAARPDRIFHLAAQASVAASWREPVATLEANVRTTATLLEAVREHAPGARVLVAGSGEEYGPVPAEAMPVREDQLPSPRNPYAASKLAAGVVAAFYAEAHDLHVVRMRAFNHAGPRQAESYVVASFARQIAAAEVAGAEAVTIRTGNIAVRRDFADVRDVVRAYWMALDAADAGLYNVCSGVATAVSAILDGLAALASIPVTQETDPALLRGNEVPEIRGSHERLTAATGWQPEIPLETTLRDTLDWWRARLTQR